MKKGFKKVLRGAACLLMIFAAGCSSDGGSSGKGSVAEDSENGTVGISVTVDGTIKCNFCGKEYQKKAEALACQHYRCNVCDSAYKSEEETLTCTDHITVTFVDSAGANDDVSQTVKSGSTVNVPDWSVAGKELAWESNNDAYSNPAAVLECEGSVSVTFTAKYTTIYTCGFCGKTYYAQNEADNCVHYICQNEDCEKHNSGYATKAEADSCSLKDGCPAYTVTCECGTVYSTDAEKESCVHYTITFADSEGVYEAEPQIIKAGVNPVVPSWTKENFTLSWSSEITAATENVTYTAIWTELPKCSNCGEHYATETAAANCAKIEGCPQFGKDNDWVAGDASPAAWLTGMTGTVSSDKNKVPYAAKNYKKYLKIKRDIAITVTPVMEGNITVYIAANKDSTDSTKTASAIFNGAAVGSAYQLPAYNAVNPDPFVIPVTEEMVGKPVVITTSYEALWFAITLNE